MSVPGARTYKEKDESSVLQKPKKDASTNNHAAFVASLFYVLKETHFALLKSIFYP